METVLIIFSAILPAICLFLLVYFLDKYKKEPLKLLLKGFAYWAILAVLIVWVYGWLLDMVYSPASTIMGATMDAFISAAIPEELAKFFLLWLLLRKNKHYDEFIDGIVYAACIGLGFAATENIGYLIDAYHNGEYHPGGWFFETGLSGERQEQYDSFREAQNYLRNYVDEDGNHYNKPEYYAAFVLLDAIK